MIVAWLCMVLSWHGFPWFFAWFFIEFERFLDVLFLMAELYQIKESVLFERKSYSEIFVKAKVNYYLANMIDQSIEAYGGMRV